VEIGVVMGESMNRQVDSKNGDTVEITPDGRAWVYLENSISLDDRLSYLYAANLAANSIGARSGTLVVTDIELDHTNYRLRVSAYQFGVA
jgi:hypothetical protein